MASGTRSGLWQSMFEAIKELRPSLVVWEKREKDLCQVERSVQWNPSRDCWEMAQMDLFSERPAVWSETWPPSGMTRNGALSALPTSVPLTSANACSLLATPQANLGKLAGARRHRRSGGPGDTR
mgnify:CR=1 FL=1